MFSSGSAGGNGGSASRVNSNMDVGFNSGIAARIEDLPRVDPCDLRRHRLFFLLSKCESTILQKIAGKTQGGQKEQRMRRRTLLGSSDPLVAQAVSLRLSGLGFFDEGLLTHDDHDAGNGDVEAAA